MNAARKWNMYVYVYIQVMLSLSLVHVESIMRIWGTYTGRRRRRRQLLQR
jgi:hypothetical protein